MKPPFSPRRRRVLRWTIGSAFATASIGLLACNRPLLKNACLPPALPSDPAVRELVARAWDGIDPAQVWDMHVHLAGTGDSGSGIVISSEMESLLHPFMMAQRTFYMNAGCADNTAGNIDNSYVARLRDMCAEMPDGVKLLLFAFERAYDERGNALPDESTMYVPDVYARDVARAAPEHFEWACSIHPWRHDAVEALRQARKDGACAVKWLPPAMGIDPASPRCDAFYAAMAELDLPLITHTGAEKAVHGPGSPEWSSPLRLRRALDHGVRVILAHCGTSGSDIDTDRGANGPRVPTFELFARMMDERRYAPNLYGDISAITLANRKINVIRTLIERREWHDRLLFGSDYPLPGILPLVWLKTLALSGLIDMKDVPALDTLRHHNPILFDFVLKRLLTSNGRRFAAGTFETRRHFERSVL